MPFEPKLSILTSLYHSEKYLSGFLAQVSGQSIFPECELLIVLNESSAEELRITRNFKEQYPEQVQLLPVEQLEPLSASWNRAWRAASAPYLAIWNVDDRRAPDSLMRQVRALDQHPDWVLSYGDYVKVPEYAVEKGELIHTPSYSPALFRRAIPHGGAFLVFRVDLYAFVGYFDEQFAVGPDFELSVRAAMKGLKMGRVDGLLGYFTDEGLGLSTREHNPSIEATAVFVRYAAYDLVRIKVGSQLEHFDIDKILVEGKWIPLSNYLPNLNRYRRMRRPLWGLGYLRNLLRAIMRKLGLIDAIYSMQKKFLKRDI